MSLNFRQLRVSGSYQLLGIILPLWIFYISVRSQFNFIINVSTFLIEPYQFIDLLYLCFTVFLCLVTLPIMYERYEYEVNYLASKGNQDVQRLFNTLDTKVLTKIPRGPVKEKKKWSLHMQCTYEIKYKATIRSISCLKYVKENNACKFISLKKQVLATTYFYEIFRVM